MVSELNIVENYFWTTIKFAVNTVSLVMRMEMFLRNVLSECRMCTNKRHAEIGFRGIPGVLNVVICQNINCGHCNNNNIIDIGYRAGNWIWSDGRVCAVLTFELTVDKLWLTRQHNGAISLYGVIPYTVTYV